MTQEKVHKRGYITAGRKHHATQDFDAAVAAMDDIEGDSENPESKLTSKQTTNIEPEKPNATGLRDVSAHKGRADSRYKRGKRRIQALWRAWLIRRYERQKLSEWVEEPQK